ncbi:UbiA-like protein EboC [Parafilimonas terrae]|uniref:4-hydroxybenzoate polyprenyltransferase n=1 Tax=Parafilimonas terrae TaxID=1465490 RepID=A0A1I5S365_9BACT|nr:UbiA-like protein EboC [Parafilimonas terrae]SFP65174.1 4-hydroxybenzoate polyprenyltransferase [Parafilimonas terrae]
MRRITGLLRLTRPANVITAVSDILAGITISGYFLNANEYSWKPVILLVISTMGLYAGGVVFNDVFDAKLDAIERPERPIPSGVVSKTAATVWGLLLLVIGIIAAANVHEGYTVSVVLSVAIAVCALVYDKWCKHHFIAGPFTMGLCRGLNLLLGISIMPAAVHSFWPLCLVPVVYIAAITTVSRGEVHGGNKANLYLAVCLYALVIATLLTFSIIQQYWRTAVFLIAGFCGMIMPPLMKAIKQPSGPLIGKAVKAGVLALILMNAAWAAAFGQFYLACIIVLLLPLSILLARLFAVT